MPYRDVREVTTKDAEIYFSHDLTDNILRLLENAYSENDEHIEEMQLKVLKNEIWVKCFHFSLDLKTGCFKSFKKIAEKWIVKL